MATKTTTHSESTFGIKQWNEKTWDGKDRKEVHGAKQTHADVVFHFDGDFKGEAIVHYLMTYIDDTQATFVGLQKMVGELGGRSGSFVLKVDGVFENAAANSTYTIVEDSGTDELAGITGGGASTATHGDVQPFSLDYSLE
jgi:hypothetical protein